MKIILVIFLNDELFVPDNGLIYGTLSISVLQGLLFDEQRFNIREAELLANKSLIEQELIIREIIIEGLGTYLNWATAYRKLEIMNEYVLRVEERHNNVVELFKNGESPAVDTIESQINLNTAQKDFQLAKEDLSIKKQKVNLFCWDENGNPLELMQSIVPQSVSVVLQLLGNKEKESKPIFENDPLINKLDNQIKLVELERKLEKEQLKPNLDIKLNTIHSLGNESLNYSFNPRDYKIGASLEIPILNRKTKGKLKILEVKKEQMGLGRSYYIAKLENEYLNLENVKIIRKETLDLSVRKENNGTLLYEAEKLKFDLGESSVFLLNQRERKLLEAKIERLLSQKKLAETINELYFLDLGQQSMIQ